MPGSAETKNPTESTTATSSMWQRVKNRTTDALQKLKDRISGEVDVPKGTYFINASHDDCLRYSTEYAPNIINQVKQALADALPQQSRLSPHRALTIPAGARIRAKQDVQGHYLVKLSDLCDCNDDLRQKIATIARKEGGWIYTEIFVLLEPDKTVYAQDS
ncbi:MAG: hypothetical protein H6774_00330 [Pseudomonadales bacterium]|nr:hypothetical protein [Pseudomonadales bacterium]